MLHDPDRHEPLLATPWHEGLAREVIVRIVRDTEQQRQPHGAWPVHPQDDEGDNLRTGFKGLYWGSSGVWWALWWLQRQGAVQLGCDPVAGLRQAEADYAAEPDNGRIEASLFMGQAGILLALWAATRADDVADRLHAVVTANTHHPANEAFLGAAGTVRAAWHLAQATRQQRWQALVRDNLHALWGGWLFDEQAGCHLWTQLLHGSTVQYFGAGHGWAGNVGALLQAAALLIDEQRATLVERCAEMLLRTASRDGDAANWRGGTYMPRSGKVDLLLQWCHGAPGFITSLSAMPVGLAPAVDELLLAAGRAIWRAGPLAKGQGLCHGTAGNGEAFLALYRRTGDVLWLERARAFAMHALAQSQQMTQHHGHGRPTLWTGDLGLAVFLWQCIQVRAGMPILDFVDE
jgi:lantibiotic modifying enzyme